MYGLSVLVIRFPIVILNQTDIVIRYNIVPGIVNFYANELIEFLYTDWRYAILR